MALRSFTVAVPVARTSLVSLIQALAGYPTMQSQGITTPQPVGRAAQLTLQSDPANTAGGFIYVGGPTLTAAANKSGSLAVGGTLNFGDGRDPILDLSQIYVLATLGAGADKLLVSVID